MSNGHVDGRGRISSIGSELRREVIEVLRLISEGTKATNEVLELVQAGVVTCLLEVPHKYH